MDRLLVSLLSFSLCACGSPGGTHSPDARLPDSSPPDTPTVDAGFDANPGDAAMSDTGVPVDPPEPVDPDLDACWPGTWCWLEGADIVALDGFESSVYAADRSGRVFHLRGDSWTELPGIFERRVHRLHVAAEDDVWAITEHRDEAGWFVDRFDGSTWSTSRTNVDPHFLAGFGDNVWVQGADQRWIRFDGREWSGWNENRLDTERYGTITRELVQGRNDPMLMPGPAPTAYAITQGVVPIVMRFDGERWSAMGALSSGWSHLSWDAGENEVRVIEYTGGSTGTDSTELRHDGNRWTPVRHAPPDRYLIGSVRGSMVSPADRRCDINLPVGDAILCGRDAGVDIYESGWLDTAFPQPVRPFSDGLWARVPAAFWAADAVSAWGEGPDDYLRLRVAEGSPVLERITDRRARRVMRDGDRVLASSLRGVGPTTDGTWVLSPDRELMSVREGTVDLVMTERAHAAAPTSADSGWAITSTPDFSGTRASVARIEGESVTVDRVFPGTEFLDVVNLIDLAIDAEGDLWVLGTKGHRSRTGVIYHRTSTGEWRSIDLPTSFWRDVQLACHGDFLYIAPGIDRGPEVFRIPHAALEGTELEGEMNDYLLAPPPDRLPAAPSFEGAELSVDESGIWLTSVEVTAKLPFHVTR